MEAAFSYETRNFEAEAPVLKVSVDLPYFTDMFRPDEAVGLARTAVESLPVRCGHVHIGRWAGSTDHWIDVLPTSGDPDPSGYEIVEEYGDLTRDLRSAGGIGGRRWGGGRCGSRCRGRGDGGGGRG
jgi:hypothetical protein